MIYCIMLVIDVRCIHCISRRRTADRNSNSIHSIIFFMGHYIWMAKCQGDIREGISPLVIGLIVNKRLTWSQTGIIRVCVHSVLQSFCFIFFFPLTYLFFLNYCWKKQTITKSLCRILKGYRHLVRSNCLKNWVFPSLHVFLFYFLFHYLMCGITRPVVEQLWI